MRDRRDLHGHVVVFERDVAIAFPKGPFGLEQIGINQPLDYYFGVGRHFEINRRALGDPDWRACERSGHAHLVLIYGKLLRSGENHDGRAADDYGARHRLAAGAIFLPVQVAAGTANSRRHADAEPVGLFQRAAVGAHVTHACFRIAGDAKGRRKIWSRVKSRSGDWNRQPRQAAIKATEIVAGDDDLLASRRTDHDWRDGIGDRVRPGHANFVNGAAHPEGVDFGRGCQRADSDGNIVVPAA